MIEEYNSIMKNDVWEIVLRPKGKWLYKIKHSTHGSIEKYMPCFVACEFQQAEGVDYDKTFTSVARYSSIKAMISIVAEIGWKIHQRDVKIYLHWNCLLIALMDGTSRFLLSLFIFCSFSSEIITPLFMFILTLSLVKMLFVIWLSISRSCCCFFCWIVFLLNCGRDQICISFLFLNLNLFSVESGCFLLDLN